MISSKLRSDQYGSEWGCRLSVPQMPGVGHDRRAAARLDRGAAVAIPAAAVRLGAVEGVVAGELVPHLVRDVVDGEEVADRGREAGAALRLAVAADDGRGSRSRRPGWPSAMCPTSNALAPTRRPMTCRLRVSVEPVQFVAWAVVKQGDPPQGPFGACHLGVRVQVEQVVVRDQLEPDRGLVLVDLAHAVDERDLRRGDVVRAAEVGRVGGIRQQGEAVGAELVARRRGMQRGRSVTERAALDEGPVRIGDLAREVGDVPALAVAVVGVDVPAAVRRADGGVEADLAEVGVDARAGIVDPVAGPRVDLRVTPREAGGHDRRGPEREALEGPVGAGQRDDRGRPVERARWRPARSSAKVWRWPRRLSAGRRRALARSVGAGCQNLFVACAWSCPGSCRAPAAPANASMSTTTSPLIASPAFIVSPPLVDAPHHPPALRRDCQGGGLSRRLRPCAVRGRPRARTAARDRSPRQRRRPPGSARRRESRGPPRPRA